MPVAPGAWHYRQSIDYMIVVQRAIISVQSSGREDVTGANILVALFAERESRHIPGLPKDTRVLEIGRAAVIGAGTMGSGIAMVYANAGIPVTISGLQIDTGQNPNTLVFWPQAGVSIGSISTSVIVSAAASPSSPAPTKKLPLAI